MNAVDLVILLVVLAATVQGFRQGAATQILSFGGFIAGLAIGAAIAPSLVRSIGEPRFKLIASFFVTFGVAAIVSTIGRVLGGRVWGALKRVRLGGLDSAMGGVVAFVASTLAVWMISSMLMSAPLGGISGGIQRSAAIRQMTKTLPPAPALLARMRGLFDLAGFPQVFAELEPEAAPVPPVSDPQVR